MWYSNPRCRILGLERSGCVAFILSNILDCVVWNVRDVQSSLLTDSAIRVCVCVCVMSALTAELFGPPVAGLATSMGALSGELWHSVTQAERVCMFICAVAALAEVSGAGRGEGVNIQQTVTAVEGRPGQDLLTQRFLQDRRMDRQTDRDGHRGGKAMKVQD